MQKLCKLEGLFIKKPVSKDFFDSLRKNIFKIPKILELENVIRIFTKTKSYQCLNEDR